MRVGGLATGMDIEAMVDKLMDAERIPYDKMKQDRTKLTWKQDAFLDLNKSLLELDNMVLKMKMNSTYNPKQVISTKENAVTATSSSKSGDRTYRIEVDKLATSAINMGEAIESIDAELDAGTHHYYTYDENGEQQTHEVKIEDGDTIKDVLNKINADDSPVRA